MPAILIANPNAGRGSGGRYLRLIEGAFRESGVDLPTTTSGGPGDVERQTLDAIENGYDSVIVAGGDGTINEAVNAIVKADQGTLLGVVPIGTGNDFVKAASIPPHWEHAAALLADRLQSGALPREVDVGRCNDRYFANGAGIGFDADAAAIADRSSAPLGDAVYLLALLRALRRLSAPVCELSTADGTVRGALTLVSFCNGPWAGGMFQFAPNAANDDGVLNMVYLDEVKRRRILTLVPKLLRGRHLAEPEVHTREVKRCSVVADRPLTWHVDGEVQKPKSSFEVELLPGALRLL